MKETTYLRPRVHKGAIIDQEDQESVLEASFNSNKEVIVS
jgi:hypothetical protein